MSVFGPRIQAASAFLFFLFLLSGCPPKPAPPLPQPPPPPVTTAKPVVREVVEWDDYTGRLGAEQTVEIRARVSGYLQSIDFRDGQVVQKGDRLYVIDPRPYQAVLNSAKAEVTQVNTRLELARNDLERAGNLLKTRAISAEEYDTRSKAVREAEAAVEAAKARVEASALDVEFTEVKAPISGRISRTLVDVGNLVSGGQANSTLLTTIVSMDPIYCYFDASEAAYLKYVRLMQNGERPSSRDFANPVFVGLADEKGFPHRGHMDFVDNRIDQQTGTMRGRAVLDNQDGSLIPGLFVRVRLIGSGKYQAIQVPDEAIGTDQSQRFVLVVKPDNSVEHRLVEVGAMIDGLRVVRSGLSAEDIIIIDGLQRVRPGIQVVPTLKELPVPPRDITLDDVPPPAPLDGDDAKPDARTDAKPLPPAKAGKA